MAPATLLLRQLSSFAILIGRSACDRDSTPPSPWHHAVEIPARESSEKATPRPGRSLPARIPSHGKAGLAPQRLGYVRIVPQPVATSTSSGQVGLGRCRWGFSRGARLTGSSGCRFSTLPLIRWFLPRVAEPCVSFLSEAAAAASAPDHGVAVGRTSRDPAPADDREPHDDNVGASYRRIEEHGGALSRRPRLMHARHARAACRTDTRQKPTMITTVGLKSLAGENKR